MPPNTQKHNHQKYQQNHMQQNSVFTNYDRNTYLATNYQQLHRNGRGLNTCSPLGRLCIKASCSIIHLEDTSFAGICY